MERTSSEAKQHYVEKMGAELGELYHALWNELVWVNSKWNEYVVLFGTKSSRIDLLNEAAGSFFRLIQDSLWEDVLLHIARITDSARSAGKDNLSIQRLPPLVDDEIASELTDLIVEASEKCEFCRDWRNRRIAHIDLALALKDGIDPLKPASRANIKAALSALSDVLNVVAEHYTESTTLFEGLGQLNGAEALLYVLDDGVRVENERRERFKAGSANPEDYAARDI